MLTALFIFFGILMVFLAKDFLILIGLEEHISGLAWKYAVAMLPGVFFIFQFEAVK